MILPAVIAMTAAGCVKMYTLPDAPPKSEWQVVEAPTESPEEAMRRFLDAKRAAIQCFAALAEGSWYRAMTWMSANTVAFFEEHSNGQGAASVFENKTLWIDGKEIEFDPVGDVFIRDLNDIRDDFGSRKDEETADRKVLYAIGSSGSARQIVFVREEDRWRLEMTGIVFDLLTE